MHSCSVAGSCVKTSVFAAAHLLGGVQVYCFSCASLSWMHGITDIFIPCWVHISSGHWKLQSCRILYTESIIVFQWTPFCDSIWSVPGWLKTRNLYNIHSFASVDPSVWFLYARCIILLVWIPVHDFLWSVPWSSLKTIKLLFCPLISSP